MQSIDEHNNLKSNSYGIADYIHASIHVLISGWYVLVLFLCIDSLKYTNATQTLQDRLLKFIPCIVSQSKDNNYINSNLNAKSQ